MTPSTAGQVSLSFSENGHSQPTSPSFIHLDFRHMMHVGVSEGALQGVTPFISLLNVTVHAPYIKEACLFSILSDVVEKQVAPWNSSITECRKVYLLSR